MFGSETFGMRPDIMTMAKAITSGYLPLSATVISEDIYRACVGQSEKLGVFAHGYTYTGHPAACAVALTGGLMRPRAPLRKRVEQLLLELESGCGRCLQRRPQSHVVPRGVRAAGDEQAGQHGRACDGRVAGHGGSSFGRKKGSGRSRIHTVRTPAELDVSRR